MEQFFEHSDLGLGALTFQKGPGTIHCWTGRIADTEILFSIILNTSELQSANLDFIRSVLQNWREYLSKAEHEIQAQIGKSPEKFGLQRAPFPETEIPAEQPQFLFYDETEWGLHFEICTLPVGEPFGLMLMLFTWPILEQFTPGKVKDLISYYRVHKKPMIELANGWYHIEILGGETLQDGGYGKSHGKAVRQLAGAEFR